MNAYVIYRFYAADGALLYVGVTADLPSRMRQHAREKPWWPQVARVESDLCGSEADALVKEGTAIVAEKPRYNIAGAAVDLEALKAALGLREKWTVSRLRTAARMALPVIQYYAPLVVAAICWLAWLVPFGCQFAVWVGLDLPAVVSAAFALCALALAVQPKPALLPLAACVAPALCGLLHAIDLFPADSVPVRAVLSSLSVLLLFGLLAWIVASARTMTAVMAGEGQ